MSQYIRIAPAAEGAAEHAHSVGTPKSLVVQVARKMVLWACVNTLILTTIGYIFVSARVEQSTLSYLSGYLTQRLRSESQVFVLGQSNLAKVEERFLAQYSNPKVLPDPDFSHYFEPKPDGSLRMRERFFNGTIDAQGLSRSGMSGFLITDQKQVPKELQRRLVLAYEVVSELGPAWKGQFANLYAAVPENGGALYWPEVPWGLQVSAKRANGLQASGPWWSSLYFDTVAKKWNVTYLRPVNHKGRQVLIAGHDILLDDLMSRLVQDHPVGASNMVIRKDGELIAHPDRLKDIKLSGPGINVGSLGDPQLESIYSSISEDAKNRPASTGVRIFENADIDAYVCYGEIAGPGWWFVTIYPRSLVLASAREAANGLLLLGLGSFAIMTLIVIWVLRERVARPISQMRAASESVSSGDYEAIADGSVTLPEMENNEIGLFAASFKSMAKRVGDSHRHLEETVLTRTIELELANQELERLSFRDGLTGAFNRRSFDRDLIPAVAEAMTGEMASSLLLCDIDFFKRYNDTYGHPAGDRVLCLVAKEMRSSAPQSRVYRYGGEEIALLIPGSTDEERRWLAEQVVRAVADLAIPHEQSPHGVVTVSGGFVTIDGSEADAAEVLAAADARLYRAKSLGRNRLIAEEPEHSS